MRSVAAIGSHMEEVGATGSGQVGGWGEIYHVILEGESYNTETDQREQTLIK